MHTRRLISLVPVLLTCLTCLNGQAAPADPAPASAPANGAPPNGPITSHTSQQGLNKNDVPVGGAAAAATSQDPTRHTIDIRMPGVRPRKEDEYMCMSAKMPDNPEYIVNFQALASADTAHHLLVYGCDKPASINTWGCRSICTGSGPKILYAWARNAPPTQMPPDVGFLVGVKDARHLVLQIHYKKPIDPSEPADESGIRLTLSKQKQKYIAGIFLLVRYSLYLPPHTPVVHGDVACTYNGQSPIYPFGYRVHAHSLSPVISAYQNNGTWSLLGKGNPQWPQAFYPINGHHEIKPGDKVFTRCTYDTTHRDTTTRIGGNHDDEMCNFYMMYYTEAEHGSSYLQCNGNDFPALFKQLPAGNDVPLPPNPALEEEAEHHHHPPHQLPGNGAEGSRIAAEVPSAYSQLGDFLRGELTGVNNGGDGRDFVGGVGDQQFKDRQVLTNPRASYLRLFRDDSPTRYDYYSDFVDGDESDDKVDPSDYIYYQVQHQRSRNRNRGDPTSARRDGRPNGLGSYGDVGQAEDEERDRYRGDKIHGMDGAHAFFGFPETQGGSDYGQNRWDDDAGRRTSYSRDDLQGGIVGNIDPGRLGPGQSRYQISSADGPARYDPDTAKPVNRQPSSGRMRTQFGKGRIGAGDGIHGGLAGLQPNSYPTKPPVVQTQAPTPKPNLLTAAPIVANKEVSGSSPMAPTSTTPDRTAKDNLPLTPTKSEIAAPKSTTSSSSTIIPAQNPAQDPKSIIVTSTFTGHGSVVEETSGWPSVTAEDNIILGQVAGVAVDKLGNIHVFHRASRVWQRNSFDMMNKMNKDLGPIKENTIIVFNPQGKVIHQWGANIFYMPHGLHIDSQDNVWVTDVGLHQVFKFDKGSKTPSITLGTKLQPGRDNQHFCKPTDVATLVTGEFYVTDGYCNSRVLKYSADGKLIKQWGTSTRGVGDDNLPPAGSFDIPHSVTVLEKRQWVCVADRENGRIQCFTTNGDFVKQFHNKEFAGRVFAVSYSPVTDILYAVNGPDLYNNQVAVSGFSIHPDMGTLIETWGPKESFRNPHDLAVSPQGDFIYVGELDPHRVSRMYVHKDIPEAQKSKKAGGLAHPSSIDGGSNSAEVQEDERGDLGASLVIGALLVVPVIFIVAVTVFMRLRKNANKGYTKAKLLSEEEGESEEDDLVS